METRVALLERIAQETRDVLKDLRSDLKAEMQGLRGEMRDLRTELKGEIQGLKSEIHELRTETKSEIHELRTEMKSETQGLRTEMKEVGARLDRRIDVLDDRQRTDFRILFGALITTTLALAGLMGHGFKWLP